MLLIVSKLSLENYCPIGYNLIGRSIFNYYDMISVGNRFHCIKLSIK